MSRIDGRKLVSLAFGGTLAALAIGQVYLPYIADKDKIRGLFEEEDMPSQAKREMKMILKEERKSQGSGNNQGETNEGMRNGPGSMWKNFRRSSS
mmetsp:Transcript_16223/g.19813  ORF Transcript_16223/g.19813 Transcript_16223/m.19813 type:complete len:95 (+) Transcript_16223:112-396(+)